MIQERFVVSDSLWVRLEPQLAGKASDSGVTAQNNRLFLKAVLWRVRTGSPWRDPPSHFGNWNSQFRRFRRWAKSGVFERLFNAMSDDPDLEYALRGGAQAHAIGRSRAGLTTARQSKRSFDERGPRSWLWSTPLGISHASFCCPAKLMT